MTQFWIMAHQLRIPAIEYILKTARIIAYSWTHLLSFRNIGCIQIAVFKPCSWLWTADHASTWAETQWLRARQEIKKDNDRSACHSACLYGPGSWQCLIRFRSNRPDRQKPKGFSWILWWEKRKGVGPVTELCLWAYCWWLAGRLTGLTQQYVRVLQVFNSYGMLRQAGYVRNYGKY